MKKILTILFALLSFGNLLSQNSFIVDGSLEIVTTGSVNIVLNDYNYINQTGSLLNVGGYWTFFGSSNQTITGTSQFENIIINKSSGELLLADDISVSGDVTMTNGKLNLNGKILDLGTTGSLVSETNTNKIYSTSSASYVRVVRTIGGGVTINPGNVGISLVTTNSLGITEIRRRNEIVDVGSSNMSINRVYSVFPSTNNGSLNATLDVNYFNSELNGLDESSLATFRRPSTSSAWVNKGGTNIQTSTGSGTGIVQNLNWMEFSEVTLALNATPLPIELLSFSADCFDGGVKLTWVTASELNSDYFEIERSRDGFNWDLVLNKPAAGNSNQVLTYEVDDKGSKLFDDILYYRLKQFDFDGYYKIYDAISINCLKDVNNYIKIYPNPSDNLFNIILNNDLLVGNSTIKMIDELGRLIYISDVSVTPGVNLFILDKLNINPGVYYISISNDGHSSRLLKQIIK
jgi:hypothetical protein